ncbi:MAG: hypothetical protein ABI682_02005 [Acidobacteriota bacterium]
MVGAITGLLVRVEEGELVVFNAPGDDIALFSRPGTSFSGRVLETIAGGGVIASVGSSTATNVRRLRLRNSDGGVIYDEKIFVYLT